MTTIVNHPSSGTFITFRERTFSTTSKIVRIVIVIIAALVAVGSILASSLSGILPLLSICGFSLLLLSIIAIKPLPPQLIGSTKIPPPTPNESPFLLTVNETTSHTKVLENCAELVTDNWKHLPNIIENSSTVFVQKVWKFNNSQTVLFSTIGSMFTPRIQCCCNLMIALEPNTFTFTNLDMLNIQYDNVNLLEGQCSSLPWKNRDGSTNKHHLGLPNSLGFLQGPDPSIHKNNPLVAYSLAKSAYTHCIQHAVMLGMDMIQLPLISTSPSQMSKNPQEAMAWKSAIQTGLATAVAQFALTNPTMNMNIVVVSPPGLGYPL